MNVSDARQPASWHAVLPTLRLVAPAFLLSRAWTALWVYLGQNTRPSIAAPIEGGYAGVANWWLNAWTTYDTEHFFRIARVGYEARTAPFFPLYPWLLRVFAPNELAMALWGIAVSNVAFLVGLWFLHRLTTLDFNAGVATRAVWLLCFSPISAVLSAVYTDASFFCFLVVALWAARNKRFAVAGTSAALAALTRNSGPIIFVALLLEWFQARHMSTHAMADEAKNDVGDNVPGDNVQSVVAARDVNSVEVNPVEVKRRDLLWVALPLVAFAAVQVGISRQLGGALTGITSHEKYGRALMWPWIPIWRDALNILAGRGDLVVTLLNLGATLGALVFGAVLWKRRPGYAVLLLGIVGMQLTLGRTFAPFTNSSLRFMTTTFPFVQMLAAWSEPLTRNRLRLIVFATIYLLICALVSYDFGIKQFVTG